MAGDWIKMVVDLHEKPEVVRLASALEQSRFEVVGRLHRFWSWFDRQSRDGHVVGVTDLFLDEIVSCDGFARQLRIVDWLDDDDDGVFLPNFESHNGKSAKTRATAADRKRKSRNQRDKGHATSVTETGPEKRREEKSSTHSPTTPLFSEELAEEGEARLKPGFPEKQTVIDYCAAKGWDTKSGLNFWLHFDQAKSNNDRPIGPTWHWWSRLEQWVMNDARHGGNHHAAAGKGSKTTKRGIDDYTPADQWDEAQNEI